MISNRIGINLKFVYHEFAIHHRISLFKANLSLRIRQLLMKYIIYIFLVLPGIVNAQSKFDSTWIKFNKSGKYEYVYPFNHGKAVFRTFNDKMGIIDYNSNVILDPIYEYLYVNHPIKSLVETGKTIKGKFKRGYIDLHGNEVIPIVYDDVFVDDLNMIRVTLNKKSGVIDSTNRNIIPLKFDYLYFDNSLIIARNNSGFEIYDSKGNKITNANFRKIERFKFDKAIAINQAGQQIIINNSGQVLMKVPVNLIITDIINENEFLFKDKVSGKAGIINSKSTIITPPIYNELVKIGKYCKATKNTDRGIIDSKGDIKIPIKYKSLYVAHYSDAEDFSKNYSYNLIAEINSKYGIINPDFAKPIVPFDFKNIETIFDKYYLVSDAKNKNGLYNTEGQQLLKIEYNLFNIWENKIFGSSGGKCSIVILDENQIRYTYVPVDSFLPYKNCDKKNVQTNYQMYMYDGKCGVVDIDGKILIPNNYQTINNFNKSEKFIVQLNGKYGVVNVHNEVLLELKYDSYHRAYGGAIFKNKNDSETKRFYY